tara:strand:+ start:148 stop:453 length:306 start_codon:yes stop_codon:yes gene_type:complete
MMEWHKKTEEQYDAHMTVIPGGEVENEAHFPEDEWCSLAMALQDFVDLMERETTVDDLIEGVYDAASMRSVKNALKRIRKNEEFMVSPSYLETYRAITEAL